MIKGYRTKGGMTNDNAFGFSHQGDYLGSCFFCKQINGKLRHKVSLVFSEGRPLNAVDAASIKTGCYSYIHDLLLMPRINDRVTRVASETVRLHVLVIHFFAEEDYPSLGQIGAFLSSIYCVTSCCKRRRLKL